MEISIDDLHSDYNEVYVWGSNFLSNLDNTFGQLGIPIEDNERTYTSPKLCSFNIIIQSISCGDDHTALITGITYSNHR